MQAYSIRRAIETVTNYPHEILINPEIELRFILYTGFGIAVSLLSLINIVVFSSTSEFRRKYVMFNAMAVADLLNGISYLTSGMFRLVYMYNGDYFVRMTSSECLLTTPWAVLMLVAGVLPALLNLFLSLERVLALEYAMWYRRVWREVHKTYLVALAAVIVALVLVFCVLLNLVHETVSDSRLCAVMNSTGRVFGTIHYSLIAVIYLICFFILSILFRKTNLRKPPSKDERRRQLMLLSITGVSVILVSIPNIVLILNEWQIPKMNDLFVGVWYCLYAAQSGLALPIYLYFRPDFRKRFLRIFLFHDEKESSLVLFDKRNNVSAVGGGGTTNDTL